jgi:chlorophyllide a hydrolase
VAIETSIWIYWGCCLLAAGFLVAKRNAVQCLLGPGPKLSSKSKGYWRSLLTGWALTLLAAASYVVFTRKSETGTYSIVDLSTFAILNGVLEQLMFIFWFLCGCYVARLAAPAREKFVFALGYSSYFTFSGLIHGVYWVKVLPAHVPVTLLMVLLLAATSLAWMWAYWRYRAVGAIIAMHIVMDFLMIGHLHSNWFEPFQLLRTVDVVVI